MNIKPHMLMACMLAIAVPTALAQMPTKEVEATIKDGHSFFYFEDYEEALPFYMSALQAQPNNANLHYRVGFCYLNIAGQKHKAIKHLEAATRSMSRSHKPNSTTETNAPIDALFYLGNAYFVGNQLQRAKAAFQRFRDTTSGIKGSYNMEYLDHQLKAIKISEEAQRAPVDFMLQNIGAQFNDRFDNYGPTMSGDGKTLAYTSRRQFYNAVMVARRQDNGTWGAPINITIDLEVDGNCHTLSLSHDGSRLYLFKEDNHDGNIFISRYYNGKWSPMKRLNRHINTQYFESHACESPDGKHLVFTSNRAGGHGDLDLYISPMLPSGDWGPAQNLGPTVNSPYNENTPFFAPSGDLLFFSSEGHNTMGGYDIFASKHQHYSSWGTPLNLGYPVNTPDDDLFFAPLGNGASGLQARFGSASYGGQDIYELNLFQPLMQRSMLTADDAPPAQPPHGHMLIAILPDTDTATIEPNTVKSAFVIDPKMPPMLHYKGRYYSVKQQPEQAKRTKPTAQTAPTKGRNVALRYAMMGATRGRSSSAAPTPWPDIKPQPTTPPTEQPSENYNYTDLTELLMLVAEPQDNGPMAKMLKNALLLNGQHNNDLIAEFTRSIRGINEQEAMARTLARFMDHLSHNVELSPVHRTRTIATSHELSNHDLFYNNISNLASYELSDVLDQLAQSDHKPTSFRALIDVLKQQQADTYYQLLPELIRLMAQQSISLYHSLPDEVQHKLYTQFEQHPKKSYRAVLIGVGATLLLTVALLIIVRYRRKKPHSSQ